MENQTVIQILESVITTDKTDQPLVSIQDRGGLVAVNKELQEIIYHVEMFFRKKTNIEHINTIDITAMTTELLQKYEIISIYDNILENCDAINDELSRNALENMIKLYLRVRAFSLTRDLAAKHSSSRKSKSLRSTIKNYSTKKIDSTDC